MPRLLDQKTLPVRMIVRFLCKASVTYNDSHPTGPIALQSPPTTDELCTYPDLHPGENINQIQNSRELEWWIDLKKAPHGYQSITQTQQ